MKPKDKGKATNFLLTLLKWYKIVNIMKHNRDGFMFTGRMEREPCNIYIWTEESRRHRRYINGKCPEKLLWSPECQQNAVWHWHLWPGRNKKERSPVFNTTRTLYPLKKVFICLLNAHWLSREHMFCFIWFTLGHFNMVYQSAHGKNLN